MHDGYLAILVFITTMLGSWLGAYLESYFKKKGENLATHEDISKLVDQVAAVTQTAKEIEANISVEMWDRQKRWELKRDVLLEASKRLAEVRTALVLFGGTHDSPPSGEPDRDEEELEKADKRFVDARNALDETRGMASVVCSYAETVIALGPIPDLANHMSLEIHKNNPISFDELDRQIETALDAIRKELGINDRAP